MTETQDQTDPPPSLTIDWARYGAMLDDWDGSDEQKHELIGTLWSIVLAFVDLGFETRGSCGGLSTEDEIPVPDMLSCPSILKNKKRARDAFTEAAERTPPCRQTETRPTP